MNKVKASYIIESEINGMDILKQIEKVGRTCYKSENKITDDSAIKFVTGLISRGHEAMIEHNSISVRFICDRGISHEIVRHRLASYGQESTRYCNYTKDKFSNQISVIEPLFWGKETYAYSQWYTACLYAENAYFNLLDDGCSPQEARNILPTSLKTEIVVTMNLREWRHFLKLRTEKAAHPQMRELTVPLLAEFKTLIPVVFNDIEIV